MHWKTYGFLIPSPILGKTMHSLRTASYSKHIRIYSDPRKDFEIQAIHTPPELPNIHYRREVFLGISIQDKFIDEVLKDLSHLKKY